MGYNTDFEGSFVIEGKMPREFVEYINEFSSTRRMKRDVNKIKKIYPDWKKYCFHGDLGLDGEYFVYETPYFHGYEDDVLEENQPPADQPGLWCQWKISTKENWMDKDITHFHGILTWDMGEKFYEYEAWLNYLKTHFFDVDGYKLSGAVLAVGEECGDAEYIIMKDSEMYIYNAMQEDILPAIKSLHQNNENVSYYLNLIGKTPKEIISAYWDDSLPFY